ncbi:MULTISPECIES: hypothetical protein [Halomonadaceae]|uniref:Uncharacterized protein n=1 Tax=Halomonas casei TaxID=2742613 RepID=A0ABR9F701_9GAMM|nr:MULTISPECIES: hypothetical protein [Halomonas]MBE0401869.1 hypothetical protein [Halomonas casei]WKD30504.1 hypothetical protein NDQ72_20650 [Halomonas sp. KG2]
MASHRVKDVTVMRLATSFRFGAKISDTANALLALQGETVPLKGLADRQDCVVPAQQFRLKHSPVPQVTFWQGGRPTLLTPPALGSPGRRQ